MHSAKWLQVDLRWDFTHTIAGLASSKLVSDAAWNLCPVGNALHGDACYYEQDKTFPSVVGRESLKIPDLPPGSWRLVIKRDYFGKVAGAVRNVSALAEHGHEFTKIDVAYLSAVAGLDYEGGLLQVCASLAQLLMPALCVVSKTQPSKFMQRVQLSASEHN
jgi:hypothetical protein